MPLITEGCIGMSTPLGRAGDGDCSLCRLLGSRKRATDTRHLKVHCTESGLVKLNLVTAPCPNHARFDHALPANALDVNLYRFAFLRHLTILLRESGFSSIRTSPSSDRRRTCRNEAVRNEVFLYRGSFITLSNRASDTSPRSSSVDLTRSTA